jgi:TRAP-type mannitol/chloroaromatic compound transport system substrate-binding protein
VNEGAWTSLPADYQAILRTAAAESALVMQSRYDARNPPALKELLDNGVQLRPFSADVITTAREIAGQIYADQAAADPGYREIYEHWTAYRALSDRWFGVAELAYETIAFAR